MPIRAGNYSRIAPGTLYCLAVAVFSFAAWSLFKPISSLMWAFIFSIILTNVVGISGAFTSGVDFCSTRLLRGVIALLGVVTSASIWFRVGIGVVNALVVVFFSLLFGLWFGGKMGLSRRLSTLIGVGTSICGASAIAATAPAIGATDEEIGLSIAGITLFGLASMFLYPLLFTNAPVNQWLNDNPNVYAVWVGSGVHETAQVVAAAGALGDGVIGPALMVKSVRIFMIGPIILVASYLFSRFDRGGLRKGRVKMVVPAFGVVFVINSVVCALLDSYSAQIGPVGYYWPSTKAFLSGNVIPFLLATAFVGVGSKVKFSSIARLGARPFVVAAFIAILAGLIALLMAAIVSPYIS